jgi:hypothetical protein
MVVFMVVGKIIRHQEKTLDYLDEEFHIGLTATPPNFAPK